MTFDVDLWIFLRSSLPSNHDREEEITLPIADKMEPWVKNASHWT